MKGTLVNLSALMFSESLTVESKGGTKYQEEIKN